MTREYLTPEKAKQVVEALLLATNEPVSATRIAQLLNASLAPTGAVRPSSAQADAAQP